MNKNNLITFYKRNLPHYTPEGRVFFITSRLTGSLPLNVIEQLKKDKLKDEKIISGIKNIPFKKEKYYNIQKLYFANFDDALDNLSNGPYWLKSKSVAKIVADALHYRDGNVYELYAYTIMPNHIHILIKPFVGQLDKLSKQKNINPNNEKKRLNKLSVPNTTNKDNKKEQLGKLLYNSETSKQIGRKKASPYFLGDIMESLKRYTAHECNRLLNRTGSFWQHENYDHVVQDQQELIRIIEYILNNPVKAGFCNTPEEWKWNYYNPELIGF